MGIVVVDEKDISLTPAVCSAASLLSSLLTLLVVEADTSCRSSIVALLVVLVVGRWRSLVAPVGSNHTGGGSCGGNRWESSLLRTSMLVGSIEY
jgi:hypothetical protein